MPEFLPMNGAEIAGLQPGAYLVFLVDSRTDIVTDADGRIALPDDLVPVFSSLSAARDYAQEAVDSQPRLCAQIFDHRGRADDPLEQIHHETIRHRFDPQRRARIECVSGGVLLVCFLIWAIFGATNDWRFFWFYLLGMKLLVVGGVLFVKGSAILIASWRKRARQANS